MTPIGKVFQLISKLSKVAEHKINIQMSILFMYTSNEQSQNKIKKTIQLTMASKI